MVTKFISIYVGIVEETKAAPGRDEEYKHIEEDEYELDSDWEIEEDSVEVIKLVNVHKTYLLGIESVSTLRGVRLTINDGEFITILGTSGGGKTTLLILLELSIIPPKGCLQMWSENQVKNQRQFACKYSFKQT